MEKIYVYFTEFKHKEKSTEKQFSGHPKPGKLYRAVKGDTSIRIPLEAKEKGLMGIEIDSSKTSVSSSKWEYEIKVVSYVPSKEDILSLPNNILEQLYSFSEEDDAISEIIEDSIKEYDGDDTLEYIEELSLVDEEESSIEEMMSIIENTDEPIIETSSAEIIKIIESYRKDPSAFNLIEYASQFFSEIILKDPDTAATITLLMRHIIEKEEDNKDSNERSNAKKNLIQYNSMPIMAINKLNKYISAESTSNVCIIDYLLAACHYILFELIKKTKTNE